MTMREILFKAKRTDNGEWEIGSLVTLPNGDYEIANKCQNPPDSDPMWKKCVITHKVDPSTICQYTGLTDKNGQKIWENDILLQKTTESHWCKWECIGVVKYGEHDWNVSEYGYTSIGFYIEPIVRKRDINKIACGLNQVDILDEHYPCEVIGNIFDNPELLNE